VRLLELYLKAFGSFSERAPIELPDLGGAGLCVFYGSNEAGKSTALRAIRALIYGIPTRSSDDFIHRYPDLRIGARMRFDDGEELAVMRRKKNKDSLYRYDDSAVIKSERLDQLVEAVPEFLFERFYGLDHQSLTDGSDALLQDDGEVGRALFGAGLGLPNLRSVLDGLEGEARELFAPKASKPAINAALTRWKDTQKEIRSVSLDPKDWAVQEKRVEEAEAQRAKLGLEIEAARIELSRLGRVKRSLPALSKRRAALARLEELASVAALPEDFETRLSEARGGREVAVEQRHRAQAKIERQMEARDALALVPEVVAERERIEATHQRVDGYASTLEQLPRREGDLARLDREIQELLGSTGGIGSDGIARLHSAVGEAGFIQALASDAAKFEDRLTTSREAFLEAQAEVERLRGAEPVAPDPGFDAKPLRVALGRGLKMGGIDDRIIEQEHILEGLDVEIEQMRVRLGLESEDVEHVEGRAFPAHDLIESTIQRFSEQAARIETLSEEARALRSERRRIDEALSKIRSGGAVPRPGELEERRGERDRSWRDLRKKVIDSIEPADLTVRIELADGFERGAAESDELADRLRVDAKRVAEEATLDATGLRLDRDLEELVQREQALEREGQVLEQEWLALWADTGIRPAAPNAMRSWRRELDDLRACLGRRREVARVRVREHSARAAVIDSLRDALGGSGAGKDDSSERLEEWIADVESVLARLEEIESTRRRHQEGMQWAEQQLSLAARQQDQAADAVEAWRIDWDRALDALGLPPGSRPEQALDRIEAMRRLVERMRERDQLADRVEKMGRELTDFESAVSELVRKCAPELADHAAAQATLRLQRMLGEALNQQTLHGKCSEALAEASEELAEAETRHQMSIEAIEALRRIAEVEDEAELDAALRRWREVEAANRALEESEAELAHLSDGRPVEEIEAESVDADPDVLAARIATLEQENEARAEEQAEAISELRSQRDELERMDGSARGADLAEVAESTLAGMRRDVTRYVELRLAKQILEREIEQYRQENQAPLLTRSGEIFEALSRGAYVRITSEVSEEVAGARLVAVPAAGGEVAVNGLSAGTRDQLFLSLRLASLEESLGRAESMPLVADDILIEFDDARSRATLEVLAEMGRKTQILLFSHHRHVAEMARELGPAATLIEL
jgi:uncharacterized protein YhaN